MPDGQTTLTIKPAPMVSLLLTSHFGKTQTSSLLLSENHCGSSMCLKFRAFSTEVLMYECKNRLLAFFTCDFEMTELIWCTL